MPRATSTFENRGWDEEPYHEADGRRLTKARARYAYDGDQRGDSTVEYLMAYAPDGDAHFVGLEHFTGTLGGRAGAFVVQHAGTWRGGAVRTTFEVVPGSGTGGLTGLRGGGTFESGHQEQYSLAWDYEV